MKGAKDVGQRVKNIDPRDNPGANFGEKGTVTAVINGVVYVDYDNGDSGNARKPEKYYKILNEGRIAKEYRNDTPSYNTTSPAPKPMKGIIETMKRMAMQVTAPNKLKLIDSGLMLADGTYTADAKEAVLQTFCDTEPSQTTLLAIADAILADRKAKKDNN